MGRQKYAPEFHPKFCDMLIEHMRKGYSFESFGAKAGCGTERLYEWVKDNEIFANAKLHATALCREFWEEIGIMRSKTIGVNPGDSRTYALNMRNRFGWTTSDTSPPPSMNVYNVVKPPPTIDLKKLTDEELEAEIQSRNRAESDA